MYVSHELCFVGMGVESNWRGLRFAMDHGVFKGIRRVAAMRDVFDRRKERGTLADWTKLVCDDVVGVLRIVVGVPWRRLVNEYVRLGTGDARSSGSGLGCGFELMRNDVDMMEYLHVNGFRVCVVDGKKELDELDDGNLKVQQSTNHVLMVAPTAFESNPMTSIDNQFMEKEVIEHREIAGGGGTVGNVVLDPTVSGVPLPIIREEESIQSVQRKVLTEYAGLHRAITDKAHGVGACVHLFTHEKYHGTPDALFPNNFFSTHAAPELKPIPTTLVLYPMRAPNRRRERRPEFLHRITAFQRYSRVVDFTPYEAQENARFLEGTGSLVLDRINRVAYVAKSTRSDPGVAWDWARELGYEVEIFDAVDESGMPIYHTNVMMAIGTHSAVVCGQSIPDDKQRAHVFQRLKAGGTRNVVDISMDQVKNFCGNILELETWCGQQAWVMSTKARNAFTEKQRALLEEGSGKKIVHADISTIERVGGGGVRCSIAELF